MAMGNHLDDSVEEMSEINMTPLVDVMLVLLIIFIITVPVLTHTVKLDLPQAANQPNPVKPETIQLSITRDGALHWNETAVSKQRLRELLADAAHKQPQPELHVRGDRKVEYEHVVQALAEAQRAGIQKLGFVTDPGA